MIRLYPFHVNSVTVAPAVAIEQANSLLSESGNAIKSAHVLQSECMADFADGPGGSFTLTVVCEIEPKDASFLDAIYQAIVAPDSAA